MQRQARLGTPDTLHQVMLRRIVKWFNVTDAEGREEFLTRLGAPRATRAR